MSAPFKKGIDYFAFNVDFFDSEPIEFISARFGTKGEIIAIKLLCLIYRAGYYIRWSEDECLLFSKRAGNNITPSLANNVVSELVRRRFFDESLLGSFGILTSADIQAFYLEATKRRQSVVMFKEYLLLPDPVRINSSVKIIPVNMNGINVNINSEKVNINPQSKVKERSLTTSTPGGVEDLKISSQEWGELPKTYQVLQTVLTAMYAYTIDRSDLPIIRDLFKKAYPSTVYAQLKSVKDKCEKAKKPLPGKPIQYIHSYMGDWNKTMTTKQRKIQTDDRAYHAQNGLAGSYAKPETIVYDDKYYENREQVAQLLEILQEDLQRGKKGNAENNETAG